MARRKHVYTVGEKVNCCSHYRKQYGGSAKKFKVDLLHDLEIPLPGKYPKELKAGSQREINTLIFTAALFTTAKRQKPPKCPLPDEQISLKCGTHIQWNIIQSLKIRKVYNM